MENVKKVNGTAETVSDSEQKKGLKPLKMLKLSESDSSSEIPEARAACAAAAGAAPDLAPGTRTLEDVAGAIGIISIALLLTFGNVLMEMFFHLIGV